MRAPSRRPLPTHAWLGPWSPDDAPPQEAWLALSAGEDARWAEVRALLEAAPTGPWARQVWQSGHRSPERLRALVEGLPGPVARAVLEGVPPWSAPDGLGDLFVAHASDEALVRYLAAPREVPVPGIPWVRVAAIAAQPKWSASWVDAIALLRSADDGPERLRAVLAASTDPTQRRWLERDLTPTDPVPEALGEALDLGLAVAFLERDPTQRRAVIGELVGRLHSSSGWVGEHQTAARQLLALTGADAVPVLAAAPGPLRTLLGPLLAHPGPGELLRALAGCGIVCDAPPDAMLLPGDLLRTGPVFAFDPKTSMFPTGHDGLAARLAELAPPLADVVFEEVPHTGDDLQPASPDQLPEAYRLRAWSGDDLVEAVVGDRSSWLDTAGVVGLLNAVSAARGAGYRFVELAGSEHGAQVLVAPEGAVRDAITAGLLPGWGDLARLEAARERFPGRELSLEQRPDTHGTELVWWRTVVDAVTDAEREIGLDDARRSQTEGDWLPGDTFGTPIHG